MTKPAVLEPAFVLNLSEAAAELRSAAAYEKEGHTARTLTREADLRVVLLVMKAGSRLREHQADATVCIQVLGGGVRLELPTGSVDLGVGQLLVLERNTPHDVTAQEDSSVLLTLGWHGKPGRDER